MELIKINTTNYYAIVLNKSGSTHTNQYYKLLQLSVNQNEQGCRIAMST